MKKKKGKKPPYNSNHAYNYDDSVELVYVRRPQDSKPKAPEKKRQEGGDYYNHADEDYYNYDQPYKKKRRRRKKGGNQQRGYAPKEASDDLVYKVKSDHPQHSNYNQYQHRDHYHKKDDPRDHYHKKHENCDHHHKRENYDDNYNKKHEHNDHYHKKDEHNDHYHKKYEHRDHYHKGSKSNYQKKTFNKRRLRNRQKNRERDSVDGYREVAENMTSDKMIDCMICMESMTHKKSKIWTCEKCCMSVHLRCMRQWSERVSKSMSVGNLPRANIRLEDGTHVLTEGLVNCPHCNHIIENKSIKYKCFCGKKTNPEPNQFLPMHSCGKKCGRFLSDTCTHRCQEMCHPGKCKPCDKVILVDCYCKKSQKSIACSEMNKGNHVLSCNKICGKLLNCGKHRCQKTCHDGPCEECPIKVMTECHCGLEEKELKCGEEFSCEAICNEKLDCGHHTCKLKCHKGKCMECPYEVKAGEKCQCGKHLIEDLLGRPRESCAEPKPGCQEICEKKLDCKHPCFKKCSEVKEGSNQANNCQHGCGVKVTKKCECKAHKFEVDCSESHKPIKCETVCNKEMSCKRHKCEKICCKDRNKKRAHKCRRTCGKMNECGKHPCMKPCHQGPCGKCDVLESRPKTCACGKAVIPPPVLCSLPPPVCFERCNKELPCGHRCYYDCHFWECLPCEEMVVKECLCGAEKQEVKCSANFQCAKKCTEKLECGHVCALKCHAKGQCQEIHEKRKQEQKSEAKSFGKNAVKNMIATFCKNLENARILEESILEKMKEQDEEKEDESENEEKAKVDIEKAEEKNKEDYEDEKKEDEKAENIEIREEISNQETQKKEIKKEEEIPEKKDSEEEENKEEVNKNEEENKEEISKVEVNKEEKEKMDFKEDLKLISDLKNSPWYSILNTSSKRDQSQKIEEIIQKIDSQTSHKTCINQCGAVKECGHVCQLPCHLSLPCPPRLLCNFKKKKTCACGERIKYIPCYQDRKSKVLACEPRCLNLKRFKSLYEKSADSIKTFFPVYLVRIAKKFPKYLKKLEHSFEKFYINTNKETLEFKIPKKSVEKQCLVKILAAKYYKMDLSYAKFKKNIFIQVFRSEDLTLPETRLSEYVRRVDKGDIKLGEDNFSVNIKFNNIQMYNNASELEAILHEFDSRFHVERYTHHMVLCLWYEDDLPKVRKTLEKSGGVYSQFYVEERQVEESLDVTEVSEQLVSMESSQPSTSVPSVSSKVEGKQQEKGTFAKKPVPKNLVSKRNFGKKRMFKNSNRNADDVNKFKRKESDSSPEISQREKKRQKKAIKFSTNMFDALG